MFYIYVYYLTDDSMSGFYFTVCISQFFENILFKSRPADEISEHLISFGSQQNLPLSAPDPFLSRSPPPFPETLLLDFYWYHNLHGLGKVCFWALRSINC